MNGQSFLDTVIQAPLLLNPVTAPIVLGGAALKQLTEGSKDKKQETATPSSQQQTPSGQTPPGGQGGYGDPGTNYDPRQQPLPPGAPDLSVLLPAVLTQLAEENRRREEAAREFYPERTQIDLEAWKQREAIARQNSLERMREKTKRDKELKVIDAWTSVTQAEIQRDTAMGLGMMNLSATLGMPNPNVLSASANAMAAGTKGYTGAQPVF